jgi:hypothetical protein
MTGVKDLSIPTWYSGYIGTANWYLRSPSRKLDNRERMITLIARMNAVLDLGVGLSDALRRYIFDFSARLVPTYMRRYTVFNHEDGCYQDMVTGASMKYLHQLSNESLARTLVCTCRNFVHLAPD